MWDLLDRLLAHPMTYFVATAMGLMLALAVVAFGQEPKVETNYYVTNEDLLKFATNLEVAAPPGMEDFYDKGYYGDPLIYCTNGYDFDIWIVTKDGAVTVPAKGNFVLTKKGE